MVTPDRLESQTNGYMMPCIAHTAHSVSGENFIFLPWNFWNYIPVNYNPREASELDVSLNGRRRPVTGTM